ncbi:Sec-independent protein translocase TatB [Streptomyces sp. NPDC008317]|uniref:Sec-independent protein translocase TatB n=1 Tax=Streptomyces sp. NPDC008317 TaxID=3364827 RepID=UPI0036E3B830
MIFDIGPLKLLTLLVLATLVFGDKLPDMITRARDLIRAVRSFADDAKEDVRRELGPEFKDFEFEDLNPRTFIAKNLLGDDDALGLREIRDSLRLDGEAEELREAARTLSDGVDLTKPSAAPVAARAADGSEPVAYQPVAYDTEAT